jgi:hypothetical protein
MGARCRTLWLPERVRLTLGSGATMGRKRTMAHSNSHRPAPAQAAAPASPTATASTAIQSGGNSSPPGCRSRGYSESGHQLEKLEFALAVAITRGDAPRIDQLRAQIAALGGNREEPGT